MKPLGVLGFTDRRMRCTYQWYQASHASQPIIAEPSSMEPHAGQIQTVLPSAS